MFKIEKLLVENKSDGVITDNKTPHFSFSLVSDRQNAHLNSYCYEICLDDEIIYKSSVLTDKNQIMVPIDKVELKSDTRYLLKLYVVSDLDEQDNKAVSFYTAKLDDEWKGKWIGKYVPIPKKSSPTPLLFKKEIEIKKNIKESYIHMTSIGVYQLFINDQRISDSYFSPGFTDYRYQIQYQTYRNTNLLTGNNKIEVIVAPGWAVGAFTYKRKNAIYSDTQKLLFELIVKYDDDSVDVFGSDDSWTVSTNHHLKFADFYDGEIYDARSTSISFEKVELCSSLKKIKVIQEYGDQVKNVEVLKPAFLYCKDNEFIYDFKQNFAGVLKLEILDAEEGQKIEIHHAEELKNEKLFIKPLRTAKASIIYICKKGKQTYSPLFTYMGFRYISISGISKDKIKVEGLALSSDTPATGKLITSNNDINRLIENIYWSGRSNFVDIPTDCPQRDERMGWTGDIAVFAPTACFNFDMSRFFDKWLLDMNASQSRGGGIRWTIPYDKGGLPNYATTVWGDAAILVPWANYLSRGDLNLLKRQYPHMKKFVNAERFWARFLSFSETEKHILKWPFHFGDWCAPNEGFKQWTHKSPWIATCYYANSVNVLSKAAKALGYLEDAMTYENLYGKISQAFEKKFLDEKGQLYFEFQTGYALALSFLKIDDTKKKYMANRLAALVKENGYHLSTGFSGTPQLLFALYDYGEIDTAKKLLLQDTYPSWLYEVKKGATTIWERWDAIREDGSFNMGLDNEDEVGGMLSFNHYSYGSVGDFLYKRIGGLSPMDGGYKHFKIDLRNRLLDYSDISYDSPYGLIKASYDINNKKISVVVPVSTTCHLVFPSGEEKLLESGTYNFNI